MSSDPSAEEARSVREGPVTVTKSFEAEEFPVPAVKFVIESDASEPVNIRLVDAIPESFPMENVGFHPDYEKDHWTAYKSHRVEYDRTLDPGESTTTVYGIRLDDTGMDPDAFLADPSLSLLDASDVGAADDAIDDVLGEDSNQLVRDVLSGEREALPGLGANDGVDAPDLTADASGGGDPHPEDVTLNLDDDRGAADESDESDESDEASPRPDAFDEASESATEPTEDAVVTAVGGGAADHDTTPETDTDTAPETDTDTAPETDTDTAPETDTNTPEEDLELELDLDDGGETEVEAEPRDAPDAPGPADPDTDSDAAERTRGPRVTAGSVLATLATELRRADADSDDVAALRDALGAEGGAESVPRSVDLRIERLQNQVEDLAAYSAGLEAFLDEEGTAEDLIEGFRADVDDLTGELDELSADVADAADDRGRLHEDVVDLRSDLSGLDDQLAAVEDRVEGTTEQLAGVDDRVDAIDDRLDAVDDRFDETADRLDRVDERLDETVDRLEDVDDRFDAVDDRLDEVAARAESADGTAARLDDEMGEVREELASLDGDIAAARESLEAEMEALHETVEEEAAPVREDVSTLREDVAELDETVEEFRAFRDRLSNALGPMVGGSAGAGVEAGAGAGTSEDDADADDEGSGDVGDDADGDDADGGDEADGGENDD
jgi:predicted  nucleic acid-binding Zn-ribbon protein